MSMHSRHLILTICSLFIALSLGATLAMAQECLPNGDVNLDGKVTPTDARLALRHFLRLPDSQLVACPYEQANVDNPTNSGITPSDALCIFQRFLGVPSCLDHETTLFSGGTLADLRALSPDLTFDNLVITGILVLPIAETVTLTVNSLTITAPGGVSYTFGTCEYRSAPNFIINASGEVRIDGRMALRGRSGTNVTSSATCNSCVGQDGGDVSITAPHLRFAGELDNAGGSGGTFVFDGGIPSSGCRGGDAGAIHFEADTITLDSADVSTRGGRGGFGGGSNGADGDSGPAALLASDRLQMLGGSVTTDGVLTLTANRTNIYGLLNYATLHETIAGAPDDAGPLVEILQPVAGSDIRLDEALDIRIQVSDAGTGIKEVRVTGLGHDVTHAGSEVVDGILNVTLMQPATPPSLQVVAVDNKGLTTMREVTDLHLTGTLMIAPGTTFRLSGDLNLGSEAMITIAGDMIVTRDGNAAITAGSLQVSPGGTVRIEDVTDPVSLTQAPSLSIQLTHTAELEGTINLSGHAGFDALNKNHGEDGGNFTLSASSIAVADTASIVTDGGNAVFHEFGFPSQRIGAAPGNGGTITLTSITGVGIAGTLSTRGGNARSSFAHCFTGGNGGAVVIQYATTVQSANASFHVSGGDGFPAFDCEDTPGQRGDILGDYSGVPNPTEIVRAGEHEPNNRLIEAQPLFAPIEISATIAPADTGDLGTSNFDIEDLYAFSLRRDIVVNVSVVSSSNAVDLDLYIIEPETLHIVASSATTASSESINGLSLTAGTYLIGVSQFGNTPTEENAYTLTIIPTAQ